MEFYIVLLLLGGGIGILSGFFGIGGAFILTPALNILGLPMTIAVGTGLTFSLGVSIMGGARHYLEGNANIKIMMSVGLASFIGILISKPVVQLLESLNASGVYIRSLYIIMLLVMGVSTLLKGRENKEGEKQSSVKSLWENIRQLRPCILVNENEKISLWVILVIGTFIGFLQGLMGVGGGFILVPILTLVFNMEMHKAVGTSLLTIIISTIFASSIYIRAGNVNIPYAIVLVIGAFMGINFGIKAIKHVSGETLKRFFAFFLLFNVVGILLKQFEFNTLSLIYVFSLTVVACGIIIGKYYMKSFRLEKKDK